MIDLERKAGLPIALDNVKLIFNKDLTPVVPNVRTVEDMKPFLLDSNASFNKRIAYYMHRNVGFPKDTEVFRKNNLIYDITVLENGFIGEEFVKTVGHYHELKPGTNTRYPEIYEVIYGHVLWVLQKIGRDENKVEKVLIVSASAGDKAVVPPGFGHVSVNIGNTPLVMANIVSTNFNSLYESYKERKGAAYYVLKNGKPKIQANKLYGNLSKAIMVKPKQNVLGLPSEPLYAIAAQDITKFLWLNNPEEFLQQLKEEECFETK